MPVTKITHCDMIYNYLSNEKPHHILAIMRDLKPGAINWAVRSRISNLVKRGISGYYGKYYTITATYDKDKLAIYQLKYDEVAHVPVHVEADGQIMFL